MNSIESLLAGNPSIEAFIEMKLGGITHYVECISISIIIRNTGHNYPSIINAKGTIIDGKMVNGECIGSPQECIDAKLSIVGSIKKEGEKPTITLTILKNDESDTKSFAMKIEGTLENTESSRTNIIDIKIEAGKMSDLEFKKFLSPALEDKIDSDLEPMFEEVSYLQNLDSEDSWPVLALDSINPENLKSGLGHNFGDSQNINLGNLPYQNLVGSSDPYCGKMQDLNYEGFSDPLIARTVYSQNPLLEPHIGDSQLSGNAEIFPNIGVHSESIASFSEAPGNDPGLMTVRSDDDYDATALPTQEAWDRLFPTTLAPGALAPIQDISSSAGGSERLPGVTYKRRGSHDYTGMSDGKRQKMNYTIPTSQWDWMDDYVEEVQGVENPTLGVIGQDMDVPFSAPGYNTLFGPQDQGMPFFSETPPRFTINYKPEPSSPVLVQNVTSSSMTSETPPRFTIHYKPEPSSPVTSQNVASLLSDLSSPVTSQNLESLLSAPSSPVPAQNLASLLSAPSSPVPAQNLASLLSELSSPVTSQNLKSLLSTPSSVVTSQQFISMALNAGYSIQDLISHLLKSDNPIPLQQLISHLLNSGYSKTRVITLLLESGCTIPRVITLLLESGCTMPLLTSSTQSKGLRVTLHGVGVGEKKPKGEDELYQAIYDYMEDDPDMKDHLSDYQSKYYRLSTGTSEGLVSQTEIQMVHQYLKLIYILIKPESSIIQPRPTEDWYFSLELHRSIETLASRFYNLQKKEDAIYTIKDNPSMFQMMFLLKEYFIPITLEKILSVYERHTGGSKNITVDGSRIKRLFSSIYEQIHAAELSTNTLKNQFIKYIDGFDAHNLLKTGQQHTMMASASQTRNIGSLPSEPETPSLIMMAIPTLASEIPVQSVELDSVTSGEREPEDSPGCTRKENPTPLDMQITVYEEAQRKVL